MKKKKISSKEFFGGTEDEGMMGNIEEQVRKECEKNQGEEEEESV